MIHTVKGFSVVNEAEVDVFLEFSCFLYNLTDTGNLISFSSAFSKSNLNIWKFSVHTLLKPSLENVEHYFASMWNECNCVVVWTFFGIALLWDWNENWWVCYPKDLKEATGLPYARWAPHEDGLHQDPENPERPSRSFDPSKDAQIETEMLWEGSADSWCPEAASALDASFPGPGSIFTVAEGLNYSTHGARGSPLLARGELENWFSSFVSKEVRCFCWAALYLGWPGDGQSEIMKRV